MSEPSKLTEDEVMSLLKCGRCGAPAYSHTDLSRASIGAEACELNVMESRASAVEKIVDARIHDALQPFRELFIAWEEKLPPAESSDPAVVTLAECIIDLGHALVPVPMLPMGGRVHMPGCDGDPCLPACPWSGALPTPVLDLEDIDGDLAEIEEIVEARARVDARSRFESTFRGVGGHMPGCEGWRPPTELGFGRTSPARCKPGCPMNESGAHDG